MFQRIIVPLDGSSRAERAIPVAANLARASQGSIVFLRVVIPAHSIGFYGAEPAVGIVPTTLETNIAEADGYLTSVATIFRDYLKDIQIETEVETGAAASTILSAARWEHGDLIVLCSHGDTGLKRWLFNSIALQTARKSPMPVLIVNEHGEAHPLENLTHPLNIMVPLDGSTLAETVLTSVMQLMTALKPTGQNRLHLLRVVDIPVVNGSMRGHAQLDPIIREKACTRAKAYLDTIVKRLQEEAQGKTQLEITTSITVSPDVAGTIIRRAEESQCDMIAIATHGRGGLMRMLMGSVTERILGYTRLPLFIVRPQEPIVEHSEAADPMADEQELPSWVGLL
ncbi:universal stress protein UspA [Reticulibacter mediterranei]|uniref:Universal stress protein UspA n=1 Tax=Reticulibacter mediterranei TaxID=2778369 RepID=A0A8J3IIX8_9CHLR|nr:universal stress protein [Reticulibacter mediterranei]GHO91605.1 universal stress protein UspA [Reticulibacter mediterranei]